MKTDLPKLFSGVPINDLKEVSQSVLGTVCTVISKHKGNWNNEDVNKLAVDAYGVFMGKVYEKSVIVRVKEKEDL